MQLKQRFKGISEAVGASGTPVGGCHIPVDLKSQQRIQREPRCHPGMLCYPHPKNSQTAPRGCANLTVTEPWSQPAAQNPWNPADGGMEG